MMNLKRIEKLIEKFSDCAEGSRRDEVLLAFLLMIESLLIKYIREPDAPESLTELHRLIAEYTASGLQTAMNNSKVH